MTLSDRSDGVMGWLRYIYDIYSHPIGVRCARVLPQVPGSGQGTFQDPDNPAGLEVRWSLSPALHTYLITRAPDFFRVLLQAKKLVQQSTYFIRQVFLDVLKKTQNSSKIH